MVENQPIPTPMDVDSTATEQSAPSSALSTDDTSVQSGIDDDMISAFITDAIDSVKRKDDVTAAQERFNKHMSSNNALMTKLITVSDKSEKAAIMKELRVLHKYVYPVGSASNFQFMLLSD
jgi:hypothetical protein